MCRSDIHFTLRFEPDIPHVTHQSGTKIAVERRHARTYKTRELIKLESTLCKLIKPFAPPSPWNCPVHLTVIYSFRAPKSLPKRKTRLPAWKTTKPDVDNLVKTLKDCLTRTGFYEDDALVALLTIGKMWVADDATHGIEIRLRDISSQENERNIE